MVIYITSHGSKLTFKNGKFIIKLPTTEKIQYPIEQTDKILVIANITITAHAIKQALRNKIPIFFIQKDGRFNGVLQSSYPPNLPLRRLQYQFSLSENHEKTYLAQMTVLAKLINSYRLILRWTKEKEIISQNLIKYKFERSKQSLLETQDINVIRGIEGEFAKFYFDIYKNILKHNFDFQSRNRYPPRDPINSMLSFGYTLLVHDIISAIKTEGLDPYFGFYHVIKYNNPTLATDLMEEFRSVVVDSLVLDLVNHNQVTEEDFQKVEERILMSRNLLKKFIEKYWDKRNQIYAINNRKYTYNQIFRIKAQSFKKFLQKERSDLFYFEIR